jgi:hypothetical protein
MRDIEALLLNKEKVTIILIYNNRLNLNNQNRSSPLSLSFITQNLHLLLFKEQEAKSNEVMREEMREDRKED